MTARTLGRILIQYDYADGYSDVFRTVYENQCEEGLRKNKQELNRLIDNLSKLTTDDNTILGFGIDAYGSLYVDHVVKGEGRKRTTIHSAHLGSDLYIDENIYEDCRGVPYVLYNIEETYTLNGVALS